MTIVKVSAPFPCIAAHIIQSQFIRLFLPLLISTMGFSPPQILILHAFTKTKYYFASNKARNALACNVISLLPHHNINLRNTGKVQNLIDGSPACQISSAFNCAYKTQKINVISIYYSNSKLNANNNSKC